MRAIQNRQQGSVSLFVVIFAALLIITIATAFIRIMLQDQSQATANDLSKSALDSAYAGVEDSKRAIVEYYSLKCNDVDDPAYNNANDIRCGTLGAALIQDTVNSSNDGWTDDCDATQQAGVATLTNGEVLVKTNAEDSDLNQAYTCVKVQMNPRDVVGSLTPSTSRLFQLKPKDNAAINKIKIQWFTLTQANQDLHLDSNVPYQLPDSWNPGRPAVMRTQLVQYKNDAGGFRLSDFDSNSRNNATLFLLPSAVGINLLDFGLDFRQSNSSTAAQPVTCTSTPLVPSRYACEVTISLPDLGTNNRDLFLKISQFYSSANTDFRITMLDAANQEVRFTDVQPAVDSTGRANDIFRRIRSRIDLGMSSVPNPESAVDITKSLCKEFAVTNDAAYAGNHPAICPVPTP